MSPEAEITCKTFGCDFKITGELPDFRYDNELTDFDTKMKVRGHHRGTRGPENGYKGHDGYAVVYISTRQKLLLEVHDAGVRGEYLLRDDS